MHELRALSIPHLHPKFRKQKLVSEAERKLSGRSVSSEKYPGGSSYAGSLDHKAPGSEAFQSSPISLRSHMATWLQRLLGHYYIEIWRCLSNSHIMVGLINPTHCFDRQSCDIDI